MSNSNKTQSLVSSRIQMFEAKNGGKQEQPYRNYRRQQDSFAKQPEIPESRGPESSVKEDEETTITTSRQDASQDAVYTSDAAYVQSGDNSTLEPPQSIESSIDPFSQDYIGYTSVQAGLEAFQQGKYEHAVANFEAALRRQRILVPDDSAVLAMTLGNIGITKMKMNLLEEAEEALMESLKYKRQKKSRSTARVLNNLAAVKAKQGHLKTALELYRQTLRELKQKGGRRSEAADALFNIGRIEIQMENYKTAYDVLAEAWRITREVYGEAHDFVAETLDLLGYVQVQTKDYKTAMISFTGSLAIYRQLYGPLNEKVANALYNIGWVREKTGQQKDALEAYSTSRELYLRLGQDENSDGPRHVIERIRILERSGKQRETQRKALEESENKMKAMAVNDTPMKESERKGILRKATQFARSRSKSRPRTRKNVSISV